MPPPASRPPRDHVVPGFDPSRPGPEGSGPPGADIVARVRRWPPVDTSFVLGRWHRDRATPRGLGQEVRAAARRGLGRGQRARTRFLIVSRARSGTTLLTRLLGQNPEIRCDREVLRSAVLRPASHLEALAASSPRPVYGAKLLSYQMAQVQRLRDPAGFLGRLAADGWQLVHLTRDTFAQTLSLAVAQSRRAFHETSRYEGRHRFDPDDFARRLLWSEALLAYERRVLEGVPHIALRYERDLAGRDAQAATAARLYEAFGAPPHDLGRFLSRSGRKTLPPDPSRTIEGYGSLLDALRARGLERLLPDPAPGTAPESGSESVSEPAPESALGSAGDAGDPEPPHAEGGAATRAGR
jgi:LPS sulfotransferase NodH